MTENRSILLYISPVASGGIEERYGRAQTELLFRRQLPTATRIETMHDRVDPGNLLVAVTDPLMIPSPGLVALLLEAIRDDEDRVAVPASTMSDQPRQRRDPPQPFLTLAQFERVSEEMSRTGEAPFELLWDRSDPGVFVCRADRLLEDDRPLRERLEGRRVIVQPRALAYRYAPQRRFLREDLLSLVAGPVRAALEIGCGEGITGAELKRRHGCRVAGIETDAAAAARATAVLDEVWSEDASTAIPRLDETFDLILGGDVVEHLVDPWALLRDLRVVVAPQGRLILSIPNVACWPIIEGLLQGRFDYTYAGHLCAGHLRFFTRATIRDLFEISGWRLDSIIPQESFLTPLFEEFLQRLDAAGIPYVREEIEPLGFYALATPR